MYLSENKPLKKDEKLNNKSPSEKIGTKIIIVEDKLNIHRN